MDRQILDPLLLEAKAPSHVQNQHQNRSLGLGALSRSLAPLKTVQNYKLQTTATGGNMKCEHAQKHSLYLPVGSYNVLQVSPVSQATRI